MHWHVYILRGPQCLGKTEVSQRLRETLDEKHKKQTNLSHKTKRNKLLNNSKKLE